MASPSTQPDTHAARRAALTAAHGQPRHMDTAVALRFAGIREHVHPRDAYAFAYRDAQAAHAWQQSTLDHHGVGHFGTYATGTGPEVVGIYDLRSAMAQLGAEPTDPGLPDDWTPTSRRGGRRRAAVLPPPDAWPKGRRGGRRRAT